jgi:hypothetical protein
MQAWLIVAAGVLLGADSPKEGGAPQVKEPPYYAKVEIQGCLAPGSTRGEPMYITVVDRLMVPLILSKAIVSQLKAWEEKNGLSTNGRDARVTGTLELLPVGTPNGVTEKRLVVIAKTLVITDNVAAELRGAKPADPLPEYATVEVLGTLLSVREHREAMCIILSPHADPAPVPLMVSKLKGWTSEKFLKANGKDIRVTGSLEIQPVGMGPGMAKKRLVIVANSMEPILSARKGS